MTDQPTPTDPLKRAILDLLCRLPLRWQAIDTEDMTATEQEALKRLVRSGLAEQRIRLRAWMEGFEQTLHMQVCVSGEYKTADVLRQMFNAVPEWLDADGRTRNRSRLESDGVIGVRLTDQGERACYEYQQFYPLEASSILDFVLGVGPGDLRRPPIPGRVTVESCRVESGGGTREETEPATSSRAQATAAEGDITVQNHIHLDQGAVVEAVLAKLAERGTAAPARQPVEEQPAPSEAAGRAGRPQEPLTEHEGQEPSGGREQTPATISHPNGEPAKNKGRTQGSVIPEEAMKRLREIPAKSEKHRKAKILIWQYRKHSSEELARLVEADAGLSIRASRVRQIRSEIDKWMKQGVPKTLSEKQERQVERIMGRLRKTYRDIPGPQWQEIMKDGDLRQTVIAELVTTDDVKEAEREGKRLLDERRRDAKRNEPEVDPDTGQPYEDDA